MLDETLYITSLYMGPTAWPKYLAFAAAVLPSLVVGLFAYRRSRLPRTLAYGALQGVLYYTLVKLTQGGYSYTLYSLAKPLHNRDFADMFTSSALDKALLYCSPALAHGLLAAAAGLLILSQLAPDGRLPRFAAGPKPGGPKQAKRPARRKQGG